MPIEHPVRCRHRNRNVRQVERHLDGMPVLFPERELPDGPGEGKTEDLRQVEVHGSDQEKDEVDGYAAGYAG